jgi:hypothetical protein
MRRIAHWLDWPMSYDERLCLWFGAVVGWLGGLITGILL